MSINTEENLVTIPVDDLIEMEERYKVQDNKTIESLQAQSQYMMDALDKMTERFNAMGKFIGDSNKAILGKLEASSDKLSFPRYTVKPTSSELTGELASAMSEAKNAFGSIYRGSTANRGKFSSITDMVAVCNPILKEHNIDASFFIGENEHGEYTITLKVAHSSNQWYETTLRLREDSPSFKAIPFPQNVAASEKYFRRYMYRAMFNLAEEE